MANVKVSSTQKICIKESAEGPVSEGYHNHLNIQEKAKAAGAAVEGGRLHFIARRKVNIPLLFQTRREVNDRETAGGHLPRPLLLKDSGLTPISLSGDPQN